MVSVWQRHVGAVPTTAAVATALAPGRALGLPPGTRHHLSDPFFQLGGALIDTPGLNADLDEHRRLALTAIEGADLLLCLVRADDISHRTVRQSLGIMRRGRQDAEMALVVTHSDPDDFEDDEDQGDFREVVAETAAGLVAFIVDGRDLSSQDGPRLRRWLTDTVTECARARFVRELEGAFHWTWGAIVSGEHPLPDSVGTPRAAVLLHEHSRWLEGREADVAAKLDRSRHDHASWASATLPTAADAQVVAGRALLSIKGTGPFDDLQASIDAAEMAGSPLRAVGIRTVARGPRRSRGSRDVVGRLIAHRVGEIASRAHKRGTPLAIADRGPNVLHVVLREPSRERGPPWSMTGLAPDGVQQQSDWYRLARVAGERLVGQPVLMVDATDLSTFDGPTLLSWLRQLAARHVQVQLPAEFDSDREHWLRRLLADDTGSWREALPEGLWPPRHQGLDRFEERRDQAQLTLAQEHADAERRYAALFRESFRPHAAEARKRLRERCLRERSALTPHLDIRARRARHRGVWVLALILIAAGLRVAVEQKVVPLAVDVDPALFAAGDAALLVAISVTLVLGTTGLLGRALVRFALRSEQVTRWVVLGLWWLRWMLAASGQHEWRTHLRAIAANQYRSSLELRVENSIAAPELPPFPRVLTWNAVRWSTRIDRTIAMFTGHLAPALVLALALVVLPIRDVFQQAVDVAGWDWPGWHRPMETFERAGVEESERTPDELLERGRALIQSGESTDAAAVLTECLVADPAATACRWELGWAHWIASDYAATVAVWTPLEALAEGERPTALNEWLAKARLRAASE